MGGNPCFAILWILLLVFIAWPVAGFACGKFDQQQPSYSVVRRRADV